MLKEAPGLGHVQERTKMSRTGARTETQGRPLIAAELIEAGGEIRLTSVEHNYGELLDLDQRPGRDGA